METYDVVVVGGGPGGYPAAIRAAQLGAKVALVEREELGGTCLNWGCISTKTLIASADLVAQIRDAGIRGVKVSGYTADYAAMAQHKNTVVRQLRGGIASLLKANGVKLFEGQAAFEARNELSVRPGAKSPQPGAGPLRLGASKVILATGSTAVLPASFPDHPRVLESRGFLGLDKLPATLIVVGGGYIGCELACLAARLGTQVVLVEMLENILTHLDADVRREVQRHMEKELGIRILTGCRVEQAAADDAGVRCQAGGSPLEADLMLVTIGRRPVTDGLNLEKAGLTTNARGHIETDASNHTRAATIYAVGDVTGGPQFAYTATAQGIIAAEAACGQPPRKNESIVPAVIFTAPEVGLVGLTEDQAKQQGRAVKIGRFPFRALGRAWSIHHVEGFVKWIADAGTGQLLGAAAVGPHASDLIAEATVAIRLELTAAELGRTLHAHPTFPEVWMHAAHDVHGECIDTAPKKSAKT